VLFHEFHLRTALALLDRTLLRALDVELTRLARRNPEHKGRLLVKDSIGKNLGSGVQQCLSTEREIRHNNLRLMSIQSNRTSMFGNIQRADRSVDLQMESLISRNRSISMESRIERRISLWIPELKGLHGGVVRILRSITNQLSHRKIRRRASKQRQQFCLVILRPDRAILGDRRRVIVARGRDGRSHRAVVLPTKHHVQRHGGDALSDVPAVEEIGEVIADVAGTAAFRSAPGVVGTALELGHKAWHVGLGFLEVTVIVHDLEGDVGAVGGGALAQIAGPALENVSFSFLFFSFLYPGNRYSPKGTNPRRRHRHFHLRWTNPCPKSGSSCWDH
jgi:hypothetical protein